MSGLLPRDGEPKMRPRRQEHPRTLLDLPRYEVLAVERWPGWSHLGAGAEGAAGFVAPGVGQQSPKAEQVDGGHFAISTSAVGTSSCWYGCTIQ